MAWRTVGGFDNLKDATSMVQDLLSLQHHRICLFCRWWQEDPQDPRAPRWGHCLRMAGKPPPLMSAVSEEGEAAMLITSPKFGCQAFDE